MKINIKLLVFLILIPYNVHCQKNNFIIHGVIDNFFDDYPIMLFSFNNDTILNVDTTTVKNGKFYFEGKEYIEDISLLSLGNYPDTVIAADVILERGIIEVSINDLRTKGTPLNDLFHSYIDSLKVYAEKSKILSVGQPKDRIIIGSPFHKLLIDQGLFMVRFKKNNIDNIVGKYYFEHEAGKSFGESFAYGSGMAAFMEIYNAADEEYKNSDSVQKILNDLKAREEKDLDLYNKRNSVIGSPYTDFEFITPQEEKRKLSDYVGKSKLILLDFWASWCGPCIAEMPYLKELYEKYNAKGLEVIGISMDTSLRRWIGGLEKIDTPWKHISDLKGTGSDLSNAYHVHGIPYAVLIDQDGYIISMGIASTMEEKIKKILETDESI